MYPLYCMMTVLGFPSVFSWILWRRSVAWKHKYAFKNVVYVLPSSMSGKSWSALRGHAVTWAGDHACTVPFSATFLSAALTWPKLSLTEFLSDLRRATMTEGLRSDWPEGRSTALGRPCAQPPWGSAWLLRTGTDTGMTRGTIVACLPRGPSSCWGTKEEEAGGWRGKWDRI